jgi:putative SOS response-associated peptidase YedK
MCYSGQVVAEWREFTRKTGSRISLPDFLKLFVFRSQDERVKIPKAMEAGFAAPGNENEQQIKALIDEFVVQQSRETEQTLFAQRKRLADAERTLLSKTTKAATESKRIASGKINWCLGKLSDLHRSELKDRDSRIFPGWYAPVMLVEHGERVVKPMRYQCRPTGKPAFYDSKYPGTYNARRDNLEGFWKGLFGVTHGVMIVNAFYENVNRHRAEGRELREGEAVENLVLEFRPQAKQDMYVACLWSRWSAPGESDLLSFAAITDEPPEEVAAAGHDRCIIPIKEEHIDAWLSPDPANLAAQYAILDDRERPYYEHRLAA